MLAWIIKTGLTVVIAMAAISVGSALFLPYVVALAYHLNLVAFFFLGFLVEPDTIRFFVLALALGFVFTVMRRITSLFNG